MPVKNRMTKIVEPCADIVQSHILHGNKSTELVKIKQGPNSQSVGDFASISTVQGAYHKTSPSHSNGF